VQSDVPPGLSRELELAEELHEVGNALTVVLGWLARATDASREGRVDELASALSRATSRAREAHVGVRRALGAGAPREAGPRARVLRAVVDEIASDLEGEAATHQVRLEVSVDDAAAPLELPQAGLVRTIVTNLLLNALAFAPEGSSVRLEVRSAASSLVVSVRDEGPGVAPEVRERLFSRSSSRPGGSGHGLVHALRLARSLGGSLALEEPARGPGTCFVVELPLPRGPLGAGAGVEPTADAITPVSSTPVSLEAHDDHEGDDEHDDEPAPVTRRAISLEGRRVLVIEDDDELASLVETVLRARGASVEKVRSRAELERVRGDAFDVVIADASPMDDDAIAVLESLRRQSPAAKLIVASGRVPPLELPEALFASYLPKPFDVGELLLLVSVL
jgi:CheY-like chemotaxis protein